VRYAVCCLSLVQLAYFINGVGELLDECGSGNRLAFVLKESIWVVFAVVEVVLAYFTPIALFISEMSI